MTVIDPGAIRYPPELPITARRAELLETIAANQVVVVAGETGSGKSTQLPKLCLELGRGVEGLIGHTQPRRIAARSIAERVASELAGVDGANPEVGGLVGYQVRFTDAVSKRTRLKLMTDGILLAEIQHDPLLRRYDTLIIDEAHERSLNIDFLLGWLHQLLPRRPDLKLIITSATIDTARFARHFRTPDGVDAPIIEVSGRTYPVDIRYRPVEDGDQTDAISAAVVQLLGEVPGDVLVFCSGEREIRDATDALEELALTDTEIVPLYARLSAGEQHRVFSSHRGRRVVVATNVAETSLTVPGVRSVVDPGTARISRFNRRTKVQRLPIEPISQASADQRAGRCGRLGPGVCIRLYSEDDLAGRPEFTDPEIQRTSLASVVLQMATLGLGDVEAFPFVDPPEAAAIRDGIALLEELGAVLPGRQGRRDWVTRLGRTLARLPLDPRLARMLVEAERLGCLHEVRIIVAGLSIQDPRERPLGQESAAAQAHGRFADDSSDLLAWIHLWNHLEQERRERSSNQFRRMCRNEFLNAQRVREWQDLHSQLRRIGRDRRWSDNSEAAHPDTIHRALLAGLLSHIGKKDPDGRDYRGPRNTRFAIAPGSSLFKKSPSWVMAAELVETNRLWARGVARVQPEWLERTAAHLLTHNYGDPWWDCEQGLAKVHHSSTLFGLPVFTNRTELLHRIDPETARWLLVDHAFVQGHWGRDAPAFAERNAARRDEVIALEIKARRDDLLVDHARLVDWFDQRLPADVVTVRRFQRWWRDQRATEPDRFDLGLDDLLSPVTDHPDESAYPETWGGDEGLGLTYVHEPGHLLDGVTIDVPLDRLRSVEVDRFDWLVPGMRLELVEGLLRTLPKPLRKQLLPIADSARRLAALLDPESEPHLRASLARHVQRSAGVDVSSDDFDLDRLPSHLRPRFRIVDDDHADEPVVLAEGTDLPTLRRELDERIRSTVAAAGHDLERSGLTAWDFGDLPRTTEVPHGAYHVTAYPALVADEGGVAIRLLPSRQEQDEAMWAGTRRLLALNRPSLARMLRPLLTTETKLALVVSPYDSPSAWLDDCVDAAVESILIERGGPVWSQEGFENLLAVVRRELADRATVIACRSVEVLVAHRELVSALGDVAEAHVAAGRDVEAQRDRLVYPGFLTTVDPDRLADVTRYLRAATHRLRRLADNARRDAELMVRVRALESEWERLVDASGDTPELEDAGWMLQELRVGLFAQHLGTSRTISEKRARNLLARLAEA